VQADIIALDGDPLKDITAVRRCFCDEGRYRLQECRPPRDSGFVGPRALSNIVNRLASLFTALSCGGHARAAKSGLMRR
jgi:hypothetical protein